MFKIPFKWNPRFVGLTGLALEEARIMYEIEDDYTKLRELAKLKISEKKDLDVELNAIDFRFGKISEYDYLLNKLNLTVQDENKKTLEKLELDYKFEKISDIEYEKTKATLNKEPWAKIINSELIVKTNRGTGKPHYDMVIELDWNEYMIQKLRDADYAGATDDIIIEQWQNDLYSSYMAEENLGDATMDIHIENAMPSNRVVAKQIDANKTEYF